MSIFDSYAPGMAFRMATKLGLHLDCSKIVKMGHMSEETARCRAVTFWGCYIEDKYETPLISMTYTDRFEPMQTLQCILPATDYADGLGHYDCAT